MTPAKRYRAASISFALFVIAWAYGSYRGPFDCAERACWKEGISSSELVACKALIDCFDLVGQIIGVASFLFFGLTLLFLVLGIVNSIRNRDKGNLISNSRE